MAMFVITQNYFILFCTFVKLSRITLKFENKSIGNYQTSLQQAQNLKKVLIFIKIVFVLKN